MLFTVGQRVECNGYQGTVVKVHRGQLSGMVDVRVPGGVTCVDSAEVKPWTTQTVDRTGKVVETGTSFKVPITRQALRDLLCTAVEGGSNYWAMFEDAERTESLDYLGVVVVEHEAHSKGVPALRRRITAEDLAQGLERLAAATFPAAKQHLADALSENGDATTADVVLQMAVFGDVIYG